MKQTLLLSLLFILRLHAADAPQARMDEKHRAFFKDYCVECHNEKKLKGKLRLDDVSFALDSVENADRWQKILNEINSGEMPPEDEKQPEAAAKTDFLDDLSRTLVTARTTLSDSGGKITMRRLNRREYKNTIRDLLGIDLRVNELPADGGAGNFDTVGSSLFMSSDQVEQYLALGRQALDEHFARMAPVASTSAPAKKIHIEAEAKNARIAESLKKRLDHRERYVKWTAAVDAAASKSENAPLAAQIRAEKKDDATHLYTAWQKLKGAPSPKDFGFTDHVHADHEGRRDWLHFVPHHRAYVEHPLTKTGVFLTIDDAYVSPRQAFNIPREWPAGDYTVRVRIAAMDGIPRERRFVEFGPQDASGVCVVASTHEITGTIAKPQVLEIPLKLSPTSDYTYMFRERGSYESDAASSRLFAEARQRNGIGPEFALWIDWIEVESKSGSLAETQMRMQKIHREPEEQANKEVAASELAFAKSLERYEKWRAAVDEAAKLPENAALVAELQALPRVKAHPPAFYQFWAQRKPEPSPKTFGFPDGEEAEFQRGQYRKVNYVKDYLALPLKDKGAYLLVQNVHPLETIAAPANWPAGEYRLRVRIGAVAGSPVERRFLQVGQLEPGSRSFSPLSTHQITGSTEQPLTLEIPLQLSVNGNRSFALREKTDNKGEIAYRMWQEEDIKTGGHGPAPALWIDWMELEGPVSASAPVASNAAQPQKLRKDPEQWANKYMPIYAQGYVEKYSRFQKWCAAMDEAAKNPEHAAEVAKLRADPRLKTQPHLFYSGFAKIKGSPPPTAFGFRDVDDAQFARSEYSYHFRYYDDYQKLPARDTGTWLMLYSLGRYTGITASEKWPAGKYTLRIRIAAADESPKERRFIEIGTGKADAADFNVLSSHQVTGTLKNPQTLEISVEINASGDRNFAIRDKRPNIREAEYAMFREAWDKTGTGPKPCIWVDYVELEGPVSAASAPNIAQSFKKHLEPELESNKRVADLHQRLGKRFEDFKRWAAAMDAFAQKPEHQQVVAKLPQQFNGWRRPIAYYQGVAALPGAPSAKDFGFIDMSSALFDGADTFQNDHPYLSDYLKLPHRESGSYLTMFKVNPKEQISADAQWPAGRYTLRIRAAAVDGSPPERRFIEVGHPDPGTRSGPADDPMVISVLKAVQVTGTIAKPQVIEIPVDISISGSRQFVLREKRPNNGAASVEIWREHLAKNKTGPKPAIWIDWIELEGPADAATAQPIAKTIKQRREVELHANAMVGGTYNGYFKGGYEAAKKFMETKQPQKGIPDEAEAKFRIRGFEQQGPTFERYLNDPLTKTGAYLTIFNVHKEEVITLPPDQPSGWLKTKHEVEKAEPGEYMLRFRIGAVKGTPKERHFVALGSRKSGDEDFTLMQTFQISGSTEAPQTIEVPVSLSAEGPRTFVLREKRDVKLDHELFTTAQKATGVGPLPALWIDWVEWEGPLVKQAPIAKVERIEPEKRRADVERGHLRFKYLNEQYAKWKAAGGEEAKVKDFDFTDKAHAEFAKVVWDSNNRWFQQYLDRPLSKTGLYLDNTVQETCEHAIDLPTDLATGDYVMRLKIGRVPDMPTERAFLSFVEASPIDKDDRTFLANKQITATLDQPETIELPFKIVPGGARKFILMEKRPLKKETISLPGRTRQIIDSKQRDPVLWIDWIEWEGPLNKTEAASTVKPVIAAGETNARQVLETFAKRAFRGKEPSAAFLDKLTALYDLRRKAGDTHETALKEPLSVILASPGFLYLQEIGQAGKAKEWGQKNDASSDSLAPILLPKNGSASLTPPELASRLSYFLWSAPPDDPLLAADLTKPEILSREVDRMIASSRADEFVSGFVHQWLGMDRLDFFQFDTKQFRDFDESAKAAARREVYETFAHLLRNHGSLAKLLKSDEIHVNGLLATYYGLEGVSGDAFQKVKLPANSPRGGLLGMAAILAMGSNGERTSPVERGAWVLRKLLHNPPPPAPPNVPQLDRLATKPVSPRERLLAHQEEPQCLQCHRKIDPIGFGLENFNAAGKWRDVDHDLKTKKDWPIDPSGQFYNGPSFQTYFDLRDQIASKTENFAQGFTESLIEYALGRPFGFVDEELADNIVKRAKAKDFAIREFIVALVTSDRFHTK